MKKAAAIISIIISAIIIIILAIFIFAMISTNEDFDTYINETKDISILLEGNPYVIRDIEEQIIQIAEAYIDNPYLSYVEYKYRNENDINAMFFCRAEYNGGKYCESINIYVDTVNKRAYSINYKYSNTKRADSHSSANLQKDVDIKSYLDSIVEESSFKNYQNAYIKFYFYFDEMESLIYDDNGHILWRSFETTTYNTF
ncbi:hypothetical protein [uncultured Clostridium sp.]|uniref:hypothetical protein n=1 Tax=uncultured Clostridium sp. TaxID=59620 RepID=UPI00272E3033|nr:hypothetical protein [uncultured Clostridium sp.]